MSTFAVRLKIIKNWQMDIIVKDSNGTQLNEGDSVQLIRDLKLKGTTSILKRGTVYNNIKLTEDDAEIECRVGKSIMVLKTMYLKKK
jgi:protein PhnA